MYLQAATYKAKLAAVAKRAAKAVAQADVQADKETAKLRVSAMCSGSPL